MKLMIVDDHTGVRNMIRHLVAAAGDEIRECNSADEAVRMAADFAPDLVTMDIRMPGLCPFEATRQIRRGNPSSRVLIVSSYDEPELRRTAADAGAAGFVVKENLVDVRQFIPRDLPGQKTPGARQKTFSPADWPRTLLSPIAQLHARVAELETHPALIANELRVPLQSIQNHAALLQRELEGKWPTAIDPNDAIRSILDECADMNTRIETLLTLANPGPRAAKFDDVFTHQLVADCWKTVRTADSRKNVKFQCAQLPNVWADEGLLRILFSQLLENALKFSRTRPVATIEISCCPVGSYAVFGISDNGIGFDMQCANRLFVPLSRLHSAARYPGAGLGLALARRIVTEHGGRIWAEGEPDAGATFYFTLPLPNSTAPSPAAQ